jgi:hypothetical protein
MGQGLNRVSIQFGVVSASSWRQEFGAVCALHVDAIEQHAERRRVDGLRIGRNGGQPESPALAAFVRNEESTAVPEQRFAAVGASSEEHEEVAAVRVGGAERADDRKQVVVSVPHVDGLCREPDAHRGGQGHRAPLQRRSLALTEPAPVPSLDSASCVLAAWPSIYPCPCSLSCATRRDAPHKTLSYRVGQFVEAVGERQFASSCP